MDDSAAGRAVDHGATEGAVARDAARVWERHFREPEAACAKARTLLAEIPDAALVARGWCLLSIAYHQLFFTSSPREAHPFLVQAREAFAAAGDRRA